MRKLPVSGGWRAAALMALAAAAGCVPALMPPQWSPGAKRVLFIHRSDSAAGTLYIVDLADEGSQAKRLPTAAPAAVSAAAWSTDGALVYYATAGAKGARLRRCRPDGSEDIEITEFPGETLPWLAPSRDGREIFALVEEAGKHGGEIVAVDLGAGMVGSLEGASKKCFAPALFGPAGRELLYVTVEELAGAEPEKHRAIVWRIPVKGGTPKELARIENAMDETPGVLAVAAGGNRFAFCGAGDAGLVVGGADARSQKRFRLPKQMVPYFATFSPKGDRLFVGALAGEKLERSRSLGIDAATGVASDIESGKALLGGRAYSSDGSVYAEHSAAGLRVAEANGKWAVFYPVTRRQSLLAARAALKDGRKNEALDLLAHGVASPHHDAPLPALLYEEAGLRVAMGGELAAAKAFVDAYLPHPECSSPPRAEVLALMRKVEPLGDRIVEPLRKAEEALDAGKFDRADGKLQEAYRIVMDPARLGGILYRRARIAERRGETRTAASLYSRAADCEGFPQRAFAALRAAHIFARLAKPTVAAERIMKTLDSEPAPAHAAALRGALATVSSVKPPLRRIEQELDPRAEGKKRLWIESYVVFSLECSPGTLDDPDDTLRLTSETIRGISIETRGGRRRMIMDGLRARIGGGQLSPGGELLAFGALGADPAPGSGWSAVCIADREGRLRVGEVELLRSGRLPDERAAKSFSWDAEGKAVIAVLHEKDEDGKNLTMRLEPR